MLIHKYWPKAISIYHMFTRKAMTKQLHYFLVVICRAFKLMLFVLWLAEKIIFGRMLPKTCPKIGLSVGFTNWCGQLSLVNKNKIFVLDLSELTTPIWNPGWNKQKSQETLSYYITRVFEPVPKYFFVSLKSLRSFASRNASWSISFLSAVFRYFSFFRLSSVSYK